MADLVVPSAPALATLPNVELMHTGTWNISTGVVTFTRDDLANAVAALDCPAVRRPVLKLGHQEPDPVQGMRWDGEPAVGYIANMAVAEGGRTLVGDYAGMPGWLGDVIASAYPDRSIEGQFDHVCQMGHTHPFVITAVALLGVVAPGIGTLQSLQDVAALYGVAAARPSGDMVAVTIHAAALREDTVPNPRAPQVAAGVTTEDVRRAFYGSDYGRSWDIWIECIELDPMQIITIDDSTGGRSRVPITIGDGDGEAAVSFGDPVPVVIRYEDAPTVAASADAPRVIRYGSRAESRPDPAPAASEPATEPVAVEPVAPSAPTNVPPVEPAAGPTPPTEGATMALDEGLRERLDLPVDADDEAILAAVEDLLDKATAPPEPTPEPQPQPEPVAAAAALPPGTVAIDEATLADLREKAEQGVAARARQLTEDRDHAIAAAINEGKTLPARREHWEKAWAADPDGTRQMLASLAPGLVPLEDVGEPGGEPTNDDEDAFYDRAFSKPGKAV
ncbi:phage protease [Nonomuraea sp. NPDC049646]|uniref:phage protease n=1 Tax=unclassified Nonomuraea TaxID=2593643 RepID=UPI0037A433BC